MAAFHLKRLVFAENRLIVQAQRVDGSARFGTLPLNHEDEVPE